MSSETLELETERNVRIARNILHKMGGRAGMLDLMRQLTDTGMTEADASMAILDMTPQGYPNFDFANGVVSLSEQ